MNSLQIAQTIKQTLYAFGTIKVMSWGAHNWQHGTLDTGEGFLMFRVQGFKFKGLVRIILAFNDAYTVQLIKKQKGELVVKDETEGLYFDDITDFIDRKVELKG